MSYCQKLDKGKDKVMFLDKDDLSSPSTIKLKEDEGFDPWEQHGLILPNGAINWDCPCLGGMASGPCGVLFRRAFTCFHNSDSKSKGAECLGDFAALTECFAKYPKLYGSQNKSSTTSATTALANAFESEKSNFLQSSSFSNMSNETKTFRVLSSGRKLETTNSSVNRILSSGRCLTSHNEKPSAKRQRKSYELDEDQSEMNDFPSTVTIPSRIQVTERTQRENEPTKKLLLQAVSDANKSVRMKLNTTNGVVKVMNPDGTTECLTTRTLAKRLKAKEPTWIDPTSLMSKTETNLGKMKIRVRNEYCTNPDEDKSSDEPSRSPMEFQDDDDDDDEFVVVVNNDYEATDDGSNIWMVNDYPYGNDDDESNKDNGTTLKRKLSDDVMSDDNDQQQYSPPTHQQSNQGKKPKRCRFWPDCHAADQCEYVHPTQRCTHFPNCIYGSECLFIHPTCRFGSNCTRFECPYLHTASTPASSPSSTNNPNANVSGRSAPSTRAENSVICKFGMQCMRPNCMYTHPRMPLARNLKWVNTKWRASDDIPLLPPAAANTVYENPFVLKTTTSTSSKQTEISN